MTKKYKLLKDLPTFKAGDEFFLSNKGNLVAGTPENPETITTNIYGVDRPVDLIAYSQKTLEEFPDILTEWFEEVKESTDSIHWLPKEGDNYYYVVYSYNPLHNEILVSAWINDDHDKAHYLCGNIYRSYEEAEKARNRRLAEVRLRRTSTFKPDFENDNGGYTVYYDPYRERLGCARNAYFNSGEPVRYETKEEAQKSIKENERDWRIYFRVEEKK